MISLCCKLRPPPILPTAFFRHYCQKNGPGGNIPQHTKLNKLSDGQVKELPGNVVKPAKTGKNNKKREKMKISLMQVGSSSVTELERNVTKVNKRTIKKAVKNYPQSANSRTAKILEKEKQANHLLSESADAAQEVHSNPLRNSLHEESETHKVVPDVSSLTHLQMNNIFVEKKPRERSIDDKNSNIANNISPTNHENSNQSTAISLENPKHALPCENVLSSNFVQKISPETISKTISLKEGIEKIKAASPTSISNTMGKKKVKKGKITEQRMKELEKKLLLLKKEKRQYRFNRQLESYLSVCVSAGLTNEACDALAYYRSTKQDFLSSVVAFNLVMSGHYDAGQYLGVVQVGDSLWSSSLEPDVSSYALMIAALHKLSLESSMLMMEQTSPQPDGGSGNSHSRKDIPCSLKYMDYFLHHYRGNINSWQMFSKQKLIDIIKDLETKDMTLDEVFADAHFPNTLYEDTLAGVRWVQPDFSPTPPPVTLSPDYACPLLTLSNDHLDYTARQPATASAYLPSQEAIKHQFNIEMQGIVSIPSLYKNTNNPFMKTKLDSWKVYWKQALLDSYNAEFQKLEEQFNASESCHPMTIYPYLKLFNAEEIVTLLLKELETIATGGEGQSPHVGILHNRVSQTMYGMFSHRYMERIGLLDKFKNVYSQYVETYAAHAEQGFNGRVALEQLASLHPTGPKLTHRPPTWPYDTRLELGKFLYNILMNNVCVWSPLSNEKHKYPGLQEVTRNVGYSNTRELQPHSLLSQVYKESSSLTFLSSEMPMTCPPHPWISAHVGANLLLPTNMVRRPPGGHHSNKAASVPLQQIYPYMDSLNTLGYTPWRINQPILDVVSEVFQTNTGESLDIPCHPSVIPRPSPPLPSASKKEKNRHSSRLLEYRKQKNEMHSLWCTALYKLSMAHYFRDRVIWFPHNVDFRGRAYPCPPHLSHFDSDVFRAIVHFAVPKPLGKVGLQWLKTHLVNLTGLKKHNSLDDRLRYCDTILPQIFDSAERPLTGERWWTGSDEPWQTLAACKELHAALHSHDPELYQSQLPIHQDGSCNGLQHYAALGRDVEGATSVNLAPSATPQDVYTAVADIVERLRATDAADPTSPNHAIATVLKGYIKRKVVKQTVMTTVYGVTRFGSILQIDKQLKDLEGFPAEKRAEACRYLSRAVFKSLEMMFMATKDIQDWFTDCAIHITKVCGQSMEWETPLGLPVVQPYYKTSAHLKKKISNTANLETLINPYMPNSVKQRNAFPPNFIHSLDACHMMLTALQCHRHGLTFASIHDCYWTHASSVDVMSKICRDEFVALHSQPVLTDLSNFLYQRYGFHYEDFTHDGSSRDSARLRLNKIVQAVPKLGQFDINLVKSSKFFFS